jgi:flagellin-like protein
MKTLKLNRKGVSPIIATLLLIVIAVAAAVVTYSFVMGFLTPGGTTTPQAILSLDVNPAPYAGNVTTAYIRNTGAAATISSVYADSVSIGTGVINGTSLPVGMTPIAITHTLTAGSHTLRIVCTDGSSLNIPVTVTS